MQIADPAVYHIRAVALGDLTALHRKTRQDASRLPACPPARNTLQPAWGGEKERRMLPQPNPSLRRPHHLLRFRLPHSARQPAVAVALYVLLLLRTCIGLTCAMMGEYHCPNPAGPTKFVSCVLPHVRACASAATPLLPKSRARGPSRPRLPSPRLGGLDILHA